MTKTVLTVVCLTILGTMSALADDTLWTRRYNGPAGSDDAARVVLTDTANNVVVVGSSPGTGTGFDFVAVKYAPDGDALWTIRIAGPGASNDDARAAALDPGGAIYITGSTGFFPDYDILTVKLNPDGSEAWRAIYEGPGASAGCPAGIAVDGAGNVFVTGYVTDVSGASADYVTIKYNPGGDTAWTAIHDCGGGRDYAYAIGLGPDGTVYVTGAGIPDEYEEDFVTVKYSATGVRQWVATYNGPGNASDIAVALAVDGQGNAYVTGRSATARPPAGTNHYATVKYDSAGQQQWAKRYTGVGYNNEPVAIALGSSAVYATGRSGRAQGDNDYATVAYDLATGDTLWTRRFNGPPEKDDAATALAVGPNDRIYVTGTSLDWSDRGDFMTLRYSPSGTQEWAARYNSTFDNDDQAVAIAVDRRSNFIVVGNSFGNGDYDIQTVKYDSSAGGGIFERSNAGQFDVRRSSFVVSPNPVASGFALLRIQRIKDSRNQVANVRVFDASGRCVFARSFDVRHSAFDIPLDCRRLSNGVYLVRLDVDGSSAYQKLVVQRNVCKN